jgi:hypothetical protein
MHAYGKLKNIKKMAELHNEFEKCGFEFRNNQLVALARYYALSSHYLEKENLIIQKVESSHLDLKTLTELLIYYVEKNNEERVATLLQQLKKFPPNSTTAKTLQKCLNRSPSPRVLNQIFQLIAATKGEFIPLSLMEILLHRFAVIMDEAHVNSILSEMKVRGMKLTNSTFVSLLEAYKRDRNAIARVIKEFSKMNFDPDLSAFHAMFRSIFLWENDAEGFNLLQGIYKAMEIRNIPENETTWRTIFSSIVVLPLTPEVRTFALKLFEKMESDSLLVKKDYPFYKACYKFCVHFSLGEKSGQYQSLMDKTKA